MRDFEDQEHTIEVLEETIADQALVIQGFELNSAQQQRENEQLRVRIASLQAKLQDVESHQDYCNLKFAEQIFALTNDLRDFPRLRSVKEAMAQEASAQSK